jgi:hypothetical protein
VEYWSLPEVRRALHIPEHVTFVWSSQRVLESYRMTREVQGFIHEILSKYKIPSLHVFGDSDGSTTLLGYKRWLKKTGWKKTKEWTPIVRDEQLFGYQVEYDGTNTLATIHGYGHHAPYLTL